MSVNSAAVVFAHGAPTGSTVPAKRMGFACAAGVASHATHVSRCVWGKSDACERLRPVHFLSKKDAADDARTANELLDRACMLNLSEASEAAAVIETVTSTNGVLHTVFRSQRCCSHCRSVPATDGLGQRALARRSVSGLHDPR